MKLNDLWKESKSGKTASSCWHKTDTEYTLEESLFLGDSIGESFGLPSLSLVVLSAAKALYGEKWAICGGAAVSKLVRPRATSDIDILAADRSTAITKLLQSRDFHQEGTKLKHTSGGEIDILDTESRYWNTPQQVVREALHTAVEQNVFGQRMNMVTPSGLIATKLGRAITNLVGSDQDRVDIINVLRKHGYQNLDGFGITDKMEDEYKRLIERAKELEEPE